MDKSAKHDLLTRERELANQFNLSPDENRLVSIFALAYQRAARHFEQYVAEGERRKTIFWRRSTLFCAVIAFMAIGAVAGLTPLKEVVPFMTLVNEKTGAATIVGVGGKHVSKDFAGDMYWLNQYVQARESYNYASQGASFQMVKEFSDSAPFNEYRNFQLSSKGYLEKLGKKYFIETKVDNIIPIHNEKGLTAQAWFTNTVVDENGVALPHLDPVSWQALISYRFGEPSKDLSKYLINPLGFKVGSYQRFEQLGGAK